MQVGPPRRRRARPVADAPVDALLARVDDLAKGWLLAVLESAPLQDAAAILAGELAREGPRICGAVVRALASDDDLRRLEAGGPLESLASRTGELVGASRVQAITEAVEALRSVIWSALREEVSYPDADQISELAERLALVIELVRVAALRRSAEGIQQPGVDEYAPAGLSEEAGGHDQVAEAAAADQGQDQAPAGASEAVETPGAEPTPGPEALERSPAADARVADGEAARPEVRGAEIGDAETRAAEALEAEAREAEGREAEAREPVPDSTQRDAGALWVSALDDDIAQSIHSSAPLALLLVDLDDADRVLAVERHAEASATFGRFAQAVRAVVRRQDILACETDTRAWIIARDTARAGAQALGSRIAHAVGDAATWRGAPLRVSVGVAVLGEDGYDSASLIGAAEEASFAAAASGIGVVRAVPSPAPGDDGPQLVG
jgi:GGDEF domain-containing protein